MTEAGAMIGMITENLEGVEGWVNLEIKKGIIVGKTVRREVVITAGSKDIL